MDGEGLHVEVAMHIGDLFGTRWKWPVMLACLALKSWPDLESQVMKGLNSQDLRVGIRYTVLVQKLTLRQMLRLWWLPLRK